MTHAIRENRTQLQMSHLKFEVDREGVAFITLNDPARPMNVTSPELSTELLAAFERVAASANIKGAVLTSGKDNCFVAGGDIKDFVTAYDRGISREEAFTLSHDWNVGFRRIETCGKPIAAAINGLALGGGLELTLCCHYRVLVDSPKALVGLPEVTIGLLPGGGGTQRLPRLIGIEKALPLLLEGKFVAPAEARELGIVHEIVSRERLLDAARRWVLAHPDARQPWDSHGWRLPGKADAAAACAGQTLLAETAQSLERTRSDYPAPLALLCAVREGTQVSIDEGLRIESQYFSTLLTGVVARNLMRTMFVNKGRADKLSRRPKNIATTMVNKLAVLGAGGTGVAIAQASTAAGIEVIPLANGESFTRTGLSAIEGCDLVIDVTDQCAKIEVGVIAAAIAAAPANAILASTASALASRMAAAGRPGRFVGLRFFSPLGKTGLVEIVAMRHTSQETLARVIDYVRQLKKTPIIVYGGDYVDRLLKCRAEEAMRMQEEGIDAALITQVAEMAGMHRRPLLAAGDAYPERNPGAIARVAPQADVEEVKQRLLYIQASEGVRCFEEGVVTDPADADLGAVLGAGFPSWTGGTLSFVETVGLKDFVAECERLAARYGDRFRPLPSLIERARVGHKFYAAT